jgi:hypothetical protein
MAHFTIRRSVVVAAVSVCVAGGLVSTWRERVGRMFTGDPWLDVSASDGLNHAVVVAELFTSEGCSSCPPADEVLSRLVREPLGSTVVLGLGEHVDYWDHLGWRDLFSSAAFSSRQTEYQRQVFRTGSIYTPQLVVDGQFEAVGSDVSAVRRAIANAARMPKAAIGVTPSRMGDGQLSVRVEINLPSDVDLHEQADIIIAMTQDHLTTDVRRGENRGRTLTHSAVVRSLTTVGSLDPRVRTFDQTATVPLGADWNLQDVRIIAILQERRSRRIVGAGATHLNAGQ